MNNATEEKNLIVDLFNEFFPSEEKSIEKNGMGLIYLIQPLVLAVALMVRNKEKIVFKENQYEQAYSISKQVLKFFVTEAPVKIAMFDKDMSYIAASKLWLKDPFFELMGRDPNGKVFRETIAGDSSKWQKIHQNCLQGIAEKKEEDNWTLSEGQQKWLRWEAQPWYISADEIGGSLIFCEDITVRKEVQIKADHLTKINEELENFAYMCPHDLQTHLRTLASFITLIEEHNHDKMDSLTQTYVSYVKVALDGMKSIIQNSLLYTELMNHSFLKEHVDMNDLLTNALVSIDASIKQKNAIIKTTKLPSIFANKTCIKRVLENLILNSIKFCTRQPIVEIQGKEEGRYIIFSIKDNGIGISLKDQEKVFDKFSRLHSNQKFPGTGLGLSYCKKILEYHEGKIWIDSTENEGSTFYLSFPNFKHYQEKPQFLPNS
ncbi:MAG: hypothetical protein BGO77_01835 [Caedibacter sp. 37-49]|nr:MAG: hypothetical protein BGO77_01835 [Caedibacter sp. 37-49]